MDLQPQERDGRNIEMSPEDRSVALSKTFEAEPLAPSILRF